MRSRVPSLAILVHVADDVLVSVGNRPWRAFLCAFGVFLATGSLVVVVGLSATNEARVAAIFDADRSRHVVARPPQDGTHALVMADLRSAERLPLLSAVAAGVTLGDVEASALPPGLGRPQSVAVTGTDADVTRAAGLEITSGRAFDTGHLSRGDRVVVVGRGAAERLGVRVVAGETAVHLDGRQYLVIGLFERAMADPTLTFSVLVPRSALPRAPDGPDRLDVVYALSATSRTGLAATSLATRLVPTAPERLELAFDPGAGAVARRVSGQLANLTLVLLAAGGVVSALIVGTVATTSVGERTGEIGLRRALGARPGEAALQFLLEGALLGAAGAAAGVAGGVALLVAACTINEWPFVLPSTVPWLALAHGTIIGTVASFFAAVRAARLDPHLALTAR
jgi:putative ABC transport system permease protein